MHTHIYRLIDRYTDRQINRKRDDFPANFPLNSNLWTSFSKHFYTNADMHILS